MLIPCGDSIELRTPPDSVYCSIQLSPDGKVYAIATTQFIQIWSAGPETLLLSQRELGRTVGLAEDVLKRMFIIWKRDSSQFAVVCGEGIIMVFTITYQESLFSLDSGFQHLTYVPSCELQPESVYNVEEYGFPLCVSAMESSLILGTDTGNLVEVEWNGICRGYPIAVPLMIHLPEITKDLPSSLQIVSLDYDLILSVLVLVLNNGSCILFHINFQSRILFSGAHVILQHGATCVCIGSYAHMIAIAQSTGSILIYRLCWKNESLVPSPCFEFNIHHYDDLYPTTNPNHSFISSMRWNWENNHLCVCYYERCVVVWNLQESIIWWKSHVHTWSEWSARGDELIYGNTSLYTQSFLITQDINVCLTKDQYYFAYNSHNLLCIHSSHNSIFPSLIPLPSSFLSSCSWPLIGMTSYPGSSLVCLYTSNDICLYAGMNDLWRVATGLIPDSDYIMSVCWISTSIIVCGVSDGNALEYSSLLFFNINDLKSDHTINTKRITMERDARIVDMRYQYDSLFVLLADEQLLVYHIEKSDFSLQLIHSILIPHTGSIARFILPLNPQSISSSLMDFGVSKEEDIEDTNPIDEILLMNHDCSCDRFIIHDSTRHSLVDSCFQVFSIQDATSPLSFLHSYFLFYSSHRYYSWLPQLNPSPSMYHTWIGPKQLLFKYIPIGFIPTTLSTLSFTNCVYTHQSSLLLESSCLAHSLLHELLLTNHSVEASSLLHSLITHRTPSLSPSLEFFLHSSLNHSSSLHLQQTLALLSSSSLFPRILIDCLRKQERTIWTRIIHNPLDILFLFRTTLYGGDLELASACISVLQGVACSGSEVAIPLSLPSKDIAYRWCDWESVRSVCQSEYLSFLNSIQFVFKPIDNTSIDVCIAHKAGIELIVILILRGMISGLSDVYRFLVMEENRHSELQEFIPSNYQIDRILTSLSLCLLQQGYLNQVIKLQREIGWTWASIPSYCPVTNYYESLTHLLIVSNLQLLPIDVFSDQSLFHDMTQKYQQQSLYVDLKFLMNAMGNHVADDWKLVVTLLTFDFDVLTKTILENRSNWSHCEVDLKNGKNEWFTAMLDYYYRQQQEKESHLA